ncbi:MAG: hypothetical protein LW878_13565, partial [Proteobacteria bacterium]|nr:hypothetical protein [Pseudomonadota bacterium]
MSAKWPPAWLINLRYLAKPGQPPGSTYGSTKSFLQCDDDNNEEEEEEAEEKEEEQETVGRALRKDKSST